MRTSINVHRDRGIGNRKKGLWATGRFDESTLILLLFLLPFFGRFQEGIV